jgi:hypothetical protein
MSKINLECAYPYEMSSLEDMKKAKEWIANIVRSAGLSNDMVSYRFQLTKCGNEEETGSLEALEKTAEGRDVLFECVYCFVRKQSNEPAHTRIVLFRGDEGIRCRIATEYGDAVQKIQNAAVKK